MFARSIIRPIVAGLTSFGVMFQALLLSVHFSLLAAPKSDAADLALSVICSEHASSNVPAQDAPSDRSSTCSLCLLCWKFSAGGLALLPQAAIVAILAPHQTFDVMVDHHRPILAYSPHPPSRGPPVLTA